MFPKTTTIASTVGRFSPHAARIVGVVALLSMLGAMAEAQTTRVPWQARPNSQLTSTPAHAGRAPIRTAQAEPPSQIVLDPPADGQVIEGPIMDGVVPEEIAAGSPMSEGVVYDDGTMLDGGMAGGCADGSCGYGPAFGPMGDDVCLDYDPYFGPFRNRLWVRADYLLWWTDDTFLPPLVTTDTDPGDDPDPALDNEDTAILFGNQDALGDARGGFRVSFGLAPDECRPWGIETSYFHLDEENELFFAETGEDLTNIGRPFFNLRPDPPAGDAGAFPEEDAYIIEDGSIAIESAVNFQGLDLVARRRLNQGCFSTFDLVTGWRWNRLDDVLAFETISREDVLGEATRQTIRERFRAKNDFNGSEIGFIYSAKRCRWSIETLLKLGIGVTDSEILVEGQTINRVDGEDTIIDGGLLALPSNSGIFEESRFTMIPELGVTVGYDLTCRLRATFGYSLIYWSRVARAADQVVLDIDPTQGEDEDALNRPIMPFRTTDFWAQGVNFGLEYRF